MRKFGVKKVCPLCRAKLPPGPEQLYDDACRLYFPIENKVKSGKLSWAALSKTQKRDMDKVIKLWRGAVDQGHVSAQFNLGLMYENGQGVKQDYAEAVRLYHKAADQGNADAQSNLGGMYDNGRGVKQDYTEAVGWYRKAADQGQVNAQSNLGTKYAQGHGVKQDEIEAMRWHHKAADQGQLHAQYNLGVMYANGLGTKQDYAEAVRWFRKAADQGDSDAQKYATQFSKLLPISFLTRSCAHCGVAEKLGSVALKPCGRCKAVFYCGKECQTHGWKMGGHRTECK
jgi:hypothetical protein